MGIKRFFTLILISSIFFSSMIGCSKSNSDGNRSLAVDPVGTDPDGGDGDNGNGSDGSDPIISNGLFSNSLGSTIPVSKALQFDPDYTGETVVSDYDGDGIPNEKEVNNFSNQFVVDYPKIVAHIAPPITMQIRIDQSDETKNHSETLTDENFQNTMANSMESRQYAQVNLKTTPVVTKESASNRQNNAASWGESDSESWSFSASGGNKVYKGSASGSKSYSHSENESFDKGFETSYMSEDTEFRDVEYQDNLSRNGMEYTEDTVETMTKNYRQSNILNSDITISENAGFVRGALYLKNESIDIPAKISNVKCTLSFRTPNGTCLPVKTFLLREDDWSDFSQEIGGGEELGPYTVEITDLNTREVREALKNGYVPQIHVVSYDITRVKDSIYNPGVDNLKMVEEAAKGRTAMIKISGTDFRESFRVCAFDVESNGDLTPGVSLKKALFNIYRSQMSGGENWETDNNGKPLTVSDANLKWKVGAPDKNEHTFTDVDSDNKYLDGNSWDKFETYIKKWTDDKNQPHCIETIRRIEALSAWNPFDKSDNSSYNPNERLSDNELSQTKYWIILHNGRYFEGDLNDPIWAGDRYEIILFDVADFNNRRQNFYYTPIQSHEELYFDTRWNSLSDSDEFSRAVNLGKIYKGDVIKLEIDLLSNRYLFDPENSIIEKDSDNDKTTWKGSDFNYNLISVEDEEAVADGMPGNFTHEAYGGTNNITVSISKANYAKKYQVTIENISTSVQKTVEISSEDLSDNSGTITLCSKTRLNWNSGEDKLDLIAGGDYRVFVKAIGSLYGVAIPKNSSTNELFTRGELKVTVDDLPDGAQQPYSAYFTASGFENEIEVNISDDIGTYTEYFIIRCSGPLNYDNPQTVDIMAKAGSNTINIATPANAVDDGIFTINVFPVNQNNLETYASHSGSQGREEYVKVEYDKYANQKLMRPKKSDDLHQFEALDFEVNFNDGSGWYKLQFLSNDNSDRKIDCRYTSYMDYDKQKFHVSFRPPAGLDEDLYASIYDVFKGGKEDADLYIRTVPSEKYRDRFWPKDDSAAQFSITDPLEFGFLNFWNYISYINLEDPEGVWYSDATYMKSILAGEKNNIPYAVNSYNVEDYFFSPLEQKSYKVTASVDSEINSGDINSINPPTFATVTRGNKTLTIENISSKYAYSYSFFWKEVKDDITDYEKILEENVLIWNGEKDIEITSKLLNDEKTNTLKYSIQEELDPNKQYVIAVVGRNKFGALSEATFYKDKQGKANPISPYSTDAPIAPEGLTIAQGTNVNDITISNINIEGITKYEVRWIKKENVADINSFDWNSDAPTSIEYSDASSVSITGLEYWKPYYFVVRGILEIPEAQDQKIYGLWSNVLTRTTGIGTDSLSAAVSWVNLTAPALGSKEGDLRVRLSGNFPNNTVSYKVKCSYTYNYNVLESETYNEDTILTETGSGSVTTASIAFSTKDSYPLNDILIYETREMKTGYTGNNGYTFADYIHYLFGNVTATITVIVKNSEGTTANINLGTKTVANP